MTRKDYVLIARVFAEYPSINALEKSTVRNLAERLGGALCDDNPRFDYNRFLKAAKVEAGHE